MKKMIFLFIFVLTQNLVAQPTITQGQFPIAVGDILTAYLNQSLFVAPTEGASQTWDYTTLDLSNSQTKHIIDPTSSGIAGLPTSTICSNLGGSIDCFLIDASGVQRTGLGGPGANFPYQDPEYILKFPISFGSNYTDNFYSSYVTSGLNGTRSGTVDAEATGYGTLLLPNSVTINNAMQLKLHEVTIDSTDIFGDWMVLNSNNITYIYYAANYHGEILSATTGTTMISGPGIDTTFLTSGTLYQTLVFAAGIESHDISNNLEIYPNPVEDRFALNNQSNMDITGFSYDIVNMQGEAIRTGIINGDYLNFDVSGLNAGLYIFNIHGDQFNASKRFMKQ